jgi:hypothetical protein
MVGENAGYNKYWKTEICEKWGLGICKYGDYCQVWPSNMINIQFAHGHHELRGGESQWSYPNTTTTAHHFDNIDKNHIEKTINREDITYPLTPSSFSLSSGSKPPAYSPGSYNTRQFDETVYKPGFGGMNFDLSKLPQITAKGFGHDGW